MWEIQVSDQTATFLYALLLGGMLCGFYDLMRAMRRVPEHAAVVFAGDLLFWTVGAFATFLFLLARTNGEVRFYVIAAELCGFVFFKLTLSRILFPPLAALFGFFYRISQWISGRLGALYRELERFFTLIAGHCGKILKIITNLQKKLLKKANWVLYTKKNKRSGEKTEI